MTFRVGQRVVCVDDGPHRDGTPSALRGGAIYTVHKCFQHRLGIGVLLVEVDLPRRFAGFYATRFRPAVERKTDISIFTAMLTPSPERVS